MAASAKEVHAVDKEHFRTNGLPGNVKVYRSTFNCVKLPELLDCVVLAWPPNARCPGLLDLVQRAFRVVYIGCNTGATVCGTPELFVHLAKRMLVHEVRHQDNCLHCYSLVTHADPQFRSEEEVCGMLNNGLFRAFGYGRLILGEMDPKLAVLEGPPSNQGAGLAVSCTL